jgi:hypothetical protein
MRVAFLVGIATPAASAAQLTADLAKDAVMASVPALIDSLWGPTDDSVTLRLGRYMHVRPILAGATASASPHDADWLEGQLATPLVLDICDAPRIVDCATGAATMVIGLSEPTLEPDGRLRVIVSMKRGSSLAPLTADIVVWLRRASDDWRYDGYEVLEIT